MPSVEHRQHKGLNNRSENSYLPTRRRQQVMQRFKSSGQAQQLFSVDMSPSPTCSTSNAINDLLPIIVLLETKRSRFGIISQA